MPGKTNRSDRHERHMKLPTNNHGQRHGKASSDLQNDSHWTQANNTAGPTQFQHDRRGNKKGETPYGNRITPDKSPVNLKAGKQGDDPTHLRGNNKGDTPSGNRNTSDKSPVNPKAGKQGALVGDNDPPLLDPIQGAQGALVAKADKQGALVGDNDPPLLDPIQGAQGAFLGDPPLLDPNLFDDGKENEDFQSCSGSASSESSESNGESESKSESETFSNPGTKRGSEAGLKTPKVKKARVSMSSRSPGEMMQLAKSIKEKGQKLVRETERITLDHLSVKCLISFLGEHRNGQVEIPYSHEAFLDTCASKGNLDHLKKLGQHGFNHLQKFLKSICENGLQETVSNPLEEMKIRVTSPTQTLTGFTFNLKDVSLESKNKAQVSEATTVVYLIIVYAMQECNPEFIVPIKKGDLIEMASKAGASYDKDGQSFKVKVQGITQDELALHEDCLSTMESMHSDELPNTLISKTFASELLVKIDSIQRKDNTFVVHGTQMESLTKSA